ncbi:sensor histidine kinase [Parafrankia sp. FMc2]|uniref:sensor histidine kinase n=1 Tax=Parafrankia sp. FMc2 TaxID=3233196 RepID=UPI0034D61692
MAERWRGPAGWSLRTRLLALLLALLAVMSAVIVLVTVVALRGVLVEQLDDRLRGASGRQVGVLLLPPAGMRPGYVGGPGSSADVLRPELDPSTLTASQRLDLALGRGQSPGTLGAILELRHPIPVPATGPEAPPAAVDQDVAVLISGVTAAIIGDGSSLTTLSGEVLATVARVPLDGQPHTYAIDGHGDYRLIARPEPDGRAILVTGLPMNELSSTLTRTAGIGAGVAALGVLAAAVAGAAIIRVTLRPLSRVAAAAARVAKLPLHRGAVDLPALEPDVDTDPRTEVGQVGAALDQMLGHIGAAFAARHATETRMRQFLADASHELRTPLAAISGYAQLTRRTRDAVPPDVVYAMARVESESARMTTLVSDLLLLARLDSGRPLDREAVDLSRLVVDAVSDAHVAAPTHRFQLDLPDEPVTTVGDPARLHQVLANLLANARAHTPSGTAVTARLTTQVLPAARVVAGSPGMLAPLGCRAVLQVIDDGPGIPPDLLPRVFERFARGDSSRSRAAGSTGLGLSIVAAVVEAHGGRVDVASRPGQTVFTVILPMAAADGPRHRAEPEPVIALGDGSTTACHAGRAGAVGDAAGDIPVPRGGPHSHS